MKKRTLAAVFGLLALVVVAVLGVNAYLDRPGRFSFRNYERIRTGMTLPELETLLDGPGEELRREEVPQYPDFTEPVPEKRVKPVVTGDQFFRWSEDRSEKEIIIGLRGGQVCSKWYWEPSP